VADSSNTADGEKQHLFIVRHGDRWDYSNPSWREKDGVRKGDSPLSALGHRQAREVGIFLDNYLADRNITDITWLSSPFLRCLQTSTEALNAFQRTDAATLPILPEYSVFEWDGHGGEWHKDLPSLEERKHYFPRLDVSHESMFVPELPEPRAEFMHRCRKMSLHLHKKYPFNPSKAIVIVSHAAGCVAMSSALTGLPLQAITPAAPCSIYGFTRTSDTETWMIDPHDIPGSLNGHTAHMSELGTTTVPWNNFGDGKKKFYTGPETSRFAPNPPAAADDSCSAETK